VRQRGYVVEKRAEGRRPVKPGFDHRSHCRGIGACDLRTYLACARAHRLAASTACMRRRVRRRIRWIFIARSAGRMHGPVVGRGGSGWQAAGGRRQRRVASASIRRRARHGAALGPAVLVSACVFFPWSGFPCQRAACFLYAFLLFLLLGK
jgi:hypothetical protein